MKIFRRVALIAVALTALLGGSIFAAKPHSRRSPWVSYTDQNKLYSLRVPSSWAVLAKGNAVVIASKEDPARRGVFGVTLRSAAGTLDESVEQALQAKGHPADAVKSPARIAGVPAIKVTGSKQGDPALRVVEYYVQNGDHQYYILLQAPRDQWDQYNAAFYSMLRTFQFLQ